MSGPGTTWHRDFKTECYHCNSPIEHAYARLEGHLSDEVMTALKETSCSSNATVKVQGETDSFGAEYEYYCERHYKAEKAMWDKFNELDLGDDHETQCDWCTATVMASRLHSIQDPDEGVAGRYYDVCQDCVDSQNSQIEEEMKND